MVVKLPPEWGVILPFRWIEIEGYEGPLNPEQFVRQSAFQVGGQDDAADFKSSDATLNANWELCRYLIKATTFAGVYIDGDRERIPYEADAYLNQLSHYAVDHDLQTARCTFDLLMEQPTWPTEWAPHMVFMAYTDYMHSGDLTWLNARYESLKTKALLDRLGADGLVESNEEHIEKGGIVDWPRCERDNYVFTGKNTVMNAFHLRAIELMARLADACDKQQDADDYRARYTLGQRRCVSH